jgi:hypothetical protein
VSESETVAVSVAQEVANLNFALRPGRTATITGTYQSSGPVAGQAVSLAVITRSVGNAVQSTGDGRTTRTDQDGAFAFRNLAPGEYTVSTGGDKDRGSVTMLLSEGDERTVVIGPRQPTPLTGIVRADSDQPPRFAPGRLRVVSVAADPEYLPPSTFTAAFTITVGPDWAFRYADIVGAYLFRLDGLPDEWFIASVSMNANDLTDVPLDVGPSRPARGPLQITISNRAATLNGKLTSVDGKPGADATIVVFAADSSRWTAASRFIKVMRPRADGQFTVSGLIPGRYLAAARDSMEEGQWEDPAFLKSLADSATPFDARLEEPATIDLKLERRQ